MADATDAIDASMAIEPFGGVGKAIETARCKEVEPILRTGITSEDDTKECERKLATDNGKSEQGAPKVLKWGMST